MYSVYFNYIILFLTVELLQSPSETLYSGFLHKFACSTTGCPSYSRQGRYHKELYQW